MCSPFVGLARSLHPPPPSPPPSLPPLPPPCALTSVISRSLSTLSRINVIFSHRLNLVPIKGGDQPRPAAALHRVFPPLHPYYLLGREHKRTAMNIMSLCNLAAHATRRRVVCLNATSPLLTARCSCQVFRVDSPCLL